MLRRNGEVRVLRNELRATVPAVRMFLAIAHCAQTWPSCAACLPTSLESQVYPLTRILHLQLTPEKCMESAEYLNALIGLVKTRVPGSWNNWCIQSSTFLLVIETELIQGAESGQGREVTGYTETWQIISKCHTLKDRKTKCGRWLRDMCPALSCFVYKG